MATWIKNQTDEQQTTAEQIIPNQTLDVQTDLKFHKVQLKAIQGAMPK